MARKWRDKRFHQSLELRSGRSPGQHDRDRVLHTFALRRLAGITQVVGAEEGHRFHNRLTHTLEVAQIARRLGERLQAEAPRTADRLGGIDPEVCEAAGLAHDLGHPPFGHAAEAELDGLARTLGGLPDGFEGNSQTFRILTRLAAHAPNYRGLDLTRATLNAVLKYPRVRAVRRRRSIEFKKFGCYFDDFTAFRWARRGVPLRGRSLEAQIMNHSDDVAYSVHDFDDFFRAGIIRLDPLLFSTVAMTDFLERWATADGDLATSIRSRRNQLVAFLDTIASGEPYIGSFTQRAVLRARSAFLIDRFVKAARMHGAGGSAKGVVIEEGVQLELRFLQRLIREQVIEQPQLGTQQAGQRRLIRNLFEIYLTAVRDRDHTVVPSLFHTELDELPKLRRRRSAKPMRRESRLVVDIIASFTEREAIAMHRRLCGFDGIPASELALK